MKRPLQKIFLTLSLLTLSVPAQPSEWDIWSAASAGYKAYKALTLTDQEVVEYVRQTVNYMDKNNKVLPATNKYSVRLKTLTAVLTKVNGIPLNFKVYQTRDVNAFACADGSVRVYSALMDNMTDDELLGVIGHEIGHVGLHHSRKGIKQELLTGALRDAIATSDSKLGVLAASSLGAIGESLMNAKYSRSQEKEADDYGYNFLKKHKKNPWSMVMALEKLQALEKKSGIKSSYIAKMFSSHPDMESRISRLKERCRKDGYKRP